MEQDKKNKRLFSGIQPTGTLHIGNFLGAIANWITYAEEHSAVYSIVDYHAMTMPYEPANVGRACTEMAAGLIASGLDPDKCTLYVQSQVPEHTELAWILSCVTPMGELSRMTQFKDKSQQNKKGVNAGLLNYPILQAADILLHKGQLVPVGADQLQHLELSRVVARNFNRRFGKTFPEPNAVTGKGARIVGLDGNAKMSKSLGNQVDLTEPYDSLKKKLSRAVTDTQRVRRDDPGRPEVCNVFSLHGHFTPEAKRAELDAGCRDASIGCFDCKMVLVAHMDQFLAPIRARSEDLLSKPDEIADILHAGATKARQSARETLCEVREKTGLGLIRP
jgi:tryptophanyl-tRNA synthetase